MAAELTTAAQQVREGRSLAATLQDSGAFPDVAIKMVEVGESTGALQEMLNSLADFYDEEIDTNLGAVRHDHRAGAAGDHGHRDRGAAAVAVSAALQPVVGAEQLAYGRPRWTTNASPRARGALRRHRRPPSSPAAEQAAEIAAGAPAGRALPAAVPRSRALQHRPRPVPHDSGGADAALRLRAVPPRGQRAGHRGQRSDRPADDRRARHAARRRRSGDGGAAVGDPGDPQEERELDARPRGRDRELPAADPARGRAGGRAAHRREADGRRQPGHPPRRHDDLHRDPAARERHPHRDAGRRGLREVPHRRRAAVGDAADRQALPQHDHLARQGHGGARHRREAHPAGRPLQAAAAGQDDRLPRLGHAERPRRGRGHPYSRQGVDQRAVPRAAPRHPRLPRGGAEAVPQVHRRALRDGAGHRPDRLGQDDDALRRRCRRSRRSKTRSSRSRIRSNTS